MIRKILIALAILILLQVANVLLRQGNRRIVCSDKQGRKIVFHLERNWLGLDGKCDADDGQRGAACRRELEVIGAEGGLCERDPVAELL